MSDESGRNEVYVTPFPEPGRKWQISSDGGYGIWWVGDELIYQDPTSMVVAVKIDTASVTPHVGESRELFRGPTWTSAGATFSPTPDAERFLVVRAGDNGSTAPLTLVVNWPVTLKR